jgi:uncharacterized protein (TIGR00661 family)
VVRLNPGDRPALVYALASMGMGHAMRALPALAWLRRHYDVHILCGGPAAALLAERFPNVHRVHRSRYFYRGDRVLVGRIYAHAAATAPRLVKSFAEVMALLARLRPAALISDFEPISGYAALALRPVFKVPILSLSNMAMFYYATPPGFDEGDRRLRVLRAQYRGIVPHADRTLAVSFAQPSMRRPGAGYAPPPIRDEVLARRAAARNDGPAVVYLGGRGSERVHRALVESRVPAVVYGAARDDTRDGIRYHAFAGERFLDDLAAARFAVNTGGHSSIVDALALGKRVVALPARGHLEQEINARALEQLGAGTRARSLTASVVRAAADDADRPLPALPLGDNAAFEAALQGELAILGAAPPP